MFTVAVIGADGAGKTTICRRLERTLPMRAKYVYMGVNLKASGLMLPTTRLIVLIKKAAGRPPDISGPPDPSRSKSPPKGAIRRAMFALRAAAWQANLIAEEWFRQTVIWLYLQRGFIVLCDRHFYSDYFAHDVVKRRGRMTLPRRIHGAMLKHIYPKPEVVVCLDAPPEVLYARKKEGTLDSLQRRRAEYLDLRGEFAHFRVVDASQPEDKVAQEVADFIQECYNEKKCRPGRAKP